MLIVLVVLLLLLLVALVAYFLGIQRGSRLSPANPPASLTQSPPQVACPQDAKACPDGSYVGRVGPNCEFAPCPSVPVPTTSTKAGWQIYQNDQYGFSLSYPPQFQALTDAQNLYGWPNAVVLFYSGGQSYDLPVEVWNSQAEYETKYPAGMANLTVKQVGNKYITLVNSNFSPVVDEIIATFTPL